MLNVENDDPAHLIMRLRTLIDCAIKNITSINDEFPDKLNRENSRGTSKMSDIIFKTTKQILLTYYVFRKL